MRSRKLELGPEMLCKYGMRGGGAGKVLGESRNTSHNYINLSVQLIFADYTRCVFDLEWSSVALKVATEYRSYV
jgi:hypothetical protein